ncbi:MAG: cysteine desulfurase [Deltaproteobacteria bacterium]|nr:cysteine desulfurase [Deltaproteobacteria bacterium]
MSATAIIRGRAGGEAETGFDAQSIRADFPILLSEVHGKSLVYLDNAATTQKPRQVIDAISGYYLQTNANIHRGVHLLSERATQAYEQARVKVQRLLHAADAREIVFVRGATEGLNLVASAYGRKVLREGDEVLVTAMEHHSNIVPWQLLCEEKGAKLRVIPMSDGGELDLQAYERLLGPRTRIVSFVHVSNALGTVNPARRLVELAHQAGAIAVVDGAQSAPHLTVDVQALDADFFVFSGHKLYGPTGIGVLWGKRALLEAMPPYQGGGDMIRSVTWEKTLFNELPYKFEAGTPDIAGAVGLGAAIDYLDRVGLERAARWESELLGYATLRLREIEGLKVVGTAREKAGVLSFVLEGIHPHDIGTVLDQEGVAIRTGHHCAQPALERLGLVATARASFAFYNTREDVDRLAAGLARVKEVFA